MNGIPKMCWQVGNNRKQLKTIQHNWKPSKTSGNTPKRTNRSLDMSSQVWKIRHHKIWRRIRHDSEQLETTLSNWGQLKQRGPIWNTSGDAITENIPTINNLLSKIKCTSNMPVKLATSENDLKQSKTNYSNPT